MRKIEEMYLMKVGSMMLEEQLIKIMWTREYLIRDLSLVQGLELSNWCIAAGYVRNYIWDYLHLKAKSTPLNDVDILYYDPNDLSEETEKKYEDLLRSQLNEYNWSIKNQARMHIRNHNQPYISIEDAMKRWPETATAVGIRIDKNSNIEVIAPHGLDDLFNLDVRISPYYKDRNIFLQRIKSKNWLELWPQLKIVEH